MLEKSSENTDLDARRVQISPWFTNNMLPLFRSAPASPIHSNALSPQPQSQDNPISNQTLKTVSSIQDSDKASRLATISTNQHLR